MNPSNKLKFIIPMLSMFLMIACSGGGSNDKSSSTLANDSNPIKVQMGGAIQGVSLLLSKAVTTIAGTASVSGTTDSIGAAARFYGPAGITTDGTNLYITDSFNNTIRKMVMSTATVTTLAGTAGPIGSTDGVGTAALFHNPYAITTDGTNLYVTSNDNTIRKIVISTGAVTTLAGTAGVSGSIDGTGGAALFKLNEGITTDGTSLYVTDSVSNTIRKIVISTGAVTTLAGTAGSSGSADGTGAAAKFNSPCGITTDGTNLYVADTNNSTIRKIVISTGAVTTLAGTAGITGSADGTGSAASFSVPTGITTDGTYLYVTEIRVFFSVGIPPFFTPVTLSKSDATGFGNTLIRRISISGGEVTTVAGTVDVLGAADGVGAAASFLSPQGIITDGTSLYVADTLNNTIRKIN